MNLSATDALPLMGDHAFTLEDYTGSRPRWCTGCGDLAILAAIQRLCREEQLAPEKLVFVGGIGCSGRFPHYMHTYGFHGLHGRALPVAEGIKIRRPDLQVFVSTGDGDCCSIGAGHWIHAIRYNMNLTVLMHDNHIYGLTKKQASPTSPRGLVSNTTPRGAYLNALDPVSTTLGVSNVSFVAQVADWIPEVLFDVLSLGFHHRGLSFIRVLQRCTEYLPSFFDPWVRDPDRILLLSHEHGIQLSPDLSRVYKNQETHDPADLHRAREIASIEDRLAVGILYRDDDVPCYEDLCRPQRLFTNESIRTAVESEFDRFTIWPVNDTKGETDEQRRV